MAETCPGSGKHSVFHYNVEACRSCRTELAKLRTVVETYSPIVPTHTFDKATKEVWVQTVAPPPPEPDPWAVAFYEAYVREPWDPKFKPGEVLWDVFHRVAAKAHELADDEAEKSYQAGYTAGVDAQAGLESADRDLRAKHWREVADHLSSCGYADAIDEVLHQATRIEEGKDPWR